MTTGDGIRASLEAIITDGLEELEASRKRCVCAAENAALKVLEAKRNMEGLKALAADAITTQLDKFQHILIGEVTAQAQPSRFCELRIEGYSAYLHGLNSDVQVQRGKYRAIVLLQKIAEVDRA